MQPRKDSILPGMIDTAILLRILQLTELDDQTFLTRWREWTNEANVESSGLYADPLDTKRHVAGQSAAFNAMAKAIAGLAYMPGGVTMFNQHYEAEPGRLARVVGSGPLHPQPMQDT